MADKQLPPYVPEAVLQAVQNPISTQISAMLKTTQIPTQMPWLKEAAQASQVFHNRVNALLQPLNAQYNQFIKDMNPVLEQAKQMSSLAEQFQHISIVPDFSRVWETLEYQKADLAKFTAILAELGWTPAWDITVKDISMWVDLTEREGIEAVREPLGQFLEELYNEEVLIEMLNEWKLHPDLQTRMHILEPSVKAHIQGEYVLSVPVLIAQIEGFVVAVNKHPGHMRPKQYKEYLLKAANEDLSASDVIASFVTNHLLESFEHGGQIPEISRHAILHGADLNYGNRATSLKIILFIDWLQRATLPASEVPA